MIPAADVSKGQTNMSYKGELQTLTKQVWDTKSVLVKPVVQPYQSAL